MSIWLQNLSFRKRRKLLTNVNFGKSQDIQQTIATQTLNPKSTRAVGTLKSLIFRSTLSFFSNQRLQCFSKQIVFDLRATNHFFCNAKIFIREIRPHSSFSKRASGSPSITRVGTVCLKTTETIMVIDNVLHVRQLTINLSSLIKLEEKDVQYSFDNDTRGLKLSTKVLGNLKILSHLMILKLVQNCGALLSQNHLNTL